MLLTNPSLVSPQFLCRYDNGHPDLPVLDPLSDGFTPPAYDPEVWNVDGHGHGKIREIASRVHFCVRGRLICINVVDKLWLAHSSIIFFVIACFTSLRYPKTGTHCAGTIGAIGGNGEGVDSVNPDPDPSKFGFFIGKGLTDSGSGSNSGVLQE